MLLFFFIIATLILAALLFFSVRLNLKYSEKLEDVREQVEESLDVLDTCYQRAAQRAKLEVLSDEPVVRDLLDDIKITRDAILLVANLIVEPLSEVDERNAEQNDS
jgi:hypothetical protein